MCADKERTDKSAELSDVLSVPHFSFFTFHFSSLLPVVVYHFDGEDDDTAGERDEVCE